MIAEVNSHILCKFLKIFGNLIVVIISVYGLVSLVLYNYANPKQIIAEYNLGTIVLGVSS